MESGENQTCETRFQFHLFQIKTRGMDFHGWPCLSCQKTLSCHKMGVEIGLGCGIWQSSGKNKLVNGGSIIIYLTLSQNDYGRL